MARRTRWPWMFVALIAAPWMGAHASWRVGMGIAGFAGPAYPGSDSESFFVYPYPDLSYRTKLLHLKRDQLRLRPSVRSHWRFGVAFNGSPPVPAGTPDARSGMPYLPATVGLGPEVSYRLNWRPFGLRTSIGVHSRFRVALRTNFHLYRVGVGGGPYIEWQSPSYSLYEVTLGVGPVWRSRRENGYFFDVPAAYATPGRPAYHAGGGYAGVRMTGSVTRDFGPYSVTAFARYRYYGGAVFHASPLLKASSTFLCGVVFAWVFMRPTA